MKSTTEYLVYEIYNGKPIHYKGYKDVLKGQKKLEDIRCKTFIQSLVISRLILFIAKNISSDFQILTSEIGLKFDKNSRRAADIAIYEKSKLQNIQDGNKYLEIPPKYVLEVDIKASSEDIEDSMSYYHKKTDELLDFGVEYVVWIFTGSQKVMLAQKGKKDWFTTNWNQLFYCIENIEINIEELVKM